MKTSIFFLSLFLAFMGSKANAFVVEPQFKNDPIKQYITKIRLNDPSCFVTVTVPRTGTAIDCNGFFHFINASGSCTNHGSNCEIAFWEAHQCARNKANEDYNLRLHRIRPNNCAVTVIMAE